VAACAANDPAVARVREILTDAVEHNGMICKRVGEGDAIASGMSPAERRAERYRAEVDPLVIAAASYQMEGRTDKAEALQETIRALKAEIRAETRDLE
jgi:hypothetical protein